MKNIRLEDIKYENVVESFGMGGPHIGNLSIKGKKVKYTFLADNEKYSTNQKFICLSKCNGTKIVIKKVFWVFNLKQKDQDFRIVLIDTSSGEIYESISIGNCLYIEEMNDNEIIYFNAFHNGIQKFKNRIQFNSENFRRINEKEFYRIEE